MISVNLYQVHKTLPHRFAESVLVASQEILDEFSSAFAELVAQPSVPAGIAAQQKSFVTYTAPSLESQAPEVTLLEARSLLASSGTTGFRTWEAALCLGTYLFSSVATNLVRGRRVLELGAGTGFLSILCAKYLGATHVLATDGSEEVIDDLKTNLRLNKLDDVALVDASILKWGHTFLGGKLDDERSDGAYDVIFGADLVGHSIA